MGRVNQVIRGKDLEFASGEEAPKQKAPKKPKKEKKLSVFDVRPCLMQIVKYSYCSASKYYDPHHIAEYVDHIRFTHGFNPRIAEVPKAHILKVLKKTDIDLAYLIRNTDLGKLIPNPFNVYAESSYDPLPSVVREGLKNALYYHDIRLFNSWKNNNEIILDGYLTLGLFMNHAKELADYLGCIAPDEPKFRLVMTRGQNVFESEELFKVKRIAKYSRETGNARLSDFISEVNSLIDGINGNIWPAEKMGHYLYNRLALTHPNLAR